MERPLPPRCAPGRPAKRPTCRIAASLAGSPLFWSETTRVRRTYVRAKLRDCEECGIPSRDYKLPATTSQDELMVLIAELNADDSIAGILVQMPLPSHLDAEAVVTAIDPAKDVDGFHPENLGRLVRGCRCAHARLRASWRCWMPTISIRRARTP